MSYSFYRVSYHIVPCLYKSLIPTLVLNKILNSSGQNVQFILNPTVQDVIVSHVSTMICNVC